MVQSEQRSTFNFFVKLNEDVYRFWWILLLLLSLPALVFLLNYLIDQYSTGIFQNSPKSGISVERLTLPPINSGDTAWILTSSTLGLVMIIPGLALFYGGMVRSKNILSTMMHSFISVSTVSVVWVLWGYSMAYSQDIGGIVGDLQWLGLIGVDLKPIEGSTIPHLAFMVFQLMFAVIAVALISGAVAERMKFSAFVLFSVLWVTLIYVPLTHWVWGGGWLAGLGILDFAGGTVVHISSGMAALACVLVLGRRQGYGTENMPPHNIPLVVVGASLMWVGWLGFNSGSALAADGIAVNAFVTTHVATASGVLAWIIMEWVHRGKPTILGATSGAISGLVAITPAAGFVEPVFSLVIGLGGGICCYLAVTFQYRLGYDDVSDVFGIHAIGGIWGVMATGLFASLGGEKGLFFGNPGQVGIQAIGVIATWIFSFAGTFFLLKILDGVVGLRVRKEDELLGLDITQHRERAYGER